MKYSFQNSIFYFLLSIFSLGVLFSIFYFLFSAIQVVQAHEEGAAKITLENSLGPILAFVIIFLAIVIGKYIKKR